MRYLLLFWAVPLGLFWGWYALSYHDINFGTLMLSRMVHDFVFEMYGGVLGVDPDTIPMLLAKACILDTLIIFAIFAYRRRKAIGVWAKGFRQPMTEARAGDLPTAG